MKRLLLVLVPVVLLVAGVVFVGRQLDSSAATHQRKVLFVGDSNIVLSATAINHALAGVSGEHLTLTAAFAALPGSGIRTPDCIRQSPCFTTEFWKSKLTEALNADKPDVIVNDLGINDALEPGTATTIGYSDYGAKIDWLMSQIPRQLPVLWTNLPCPLEPADRAEGCRMIDIALAAARPRWPNLHVLDWSLAAANHDDYFQTPTPDVHLSTAGQNAWATFVAVALATRPSS